MMDLGSGVCAPKSPGCVICPLTLDCEGRRRGLAASLPRKAPKAARPQRRGAAFWIERADGCVLVRTREPKGLLGGMTELPGTHWAEGFEPDDSLAPVAADYVSAGLARHVFTHFELTLEVFRASVPARTPAPPGCRWVALGDLPGEALPTVMRKAVALAARTHGES